MNLTRPFCLFILSISIILLGPFMLAQENSLIPSYSFKKYQLPEGQRSNSVQSIAQDHYGFMWFASKNGLHRWDGYQFKTYRHDPEDSTSIGGNYIEKIFVSKNGSLWLGLGGGLEKGLLDRFDYKTETFHHYDFSSEMTTNMKAHFVVDILEDSMGDIWLGTHYGIYRLNIKSGIFKQYLHDPKNPNSLSHNICRSVYKDSEGILWFGTGLFWDQSSEGGLNRYQPETDDFAHYFHDPKNPNSLKSNIITELFEDSRNDFWVGTTNGGLHKMNRQNGTFERFFNDSPKKYILSVAGNFNDTNTYVQVIFEDQQQKLWIGFHNRGILYYDPDIKRTKDYESDINDPESLPVNPYGA